MNEQDARHRLPLRGQLAGLLMGAAVGVSVNELSDAFGYRAAAALIAAAAVVAAVSWLRTLPAGAPLVGSTRVTALALALVAAVSAAVVPRSWAAPVTITAVLLIGIAISVTGDLPAAGRVLGGAATVGLAVAAAAGGAAPETDRNGLFRLLFVLTGLVLLAVGVAVLRGTRRPRAVAYLGAGGTLVVLGLLTGLVAVIVPGQRENLLVAPLLGALGGAYVVLAVGILRGDDRWRGAAYFGIGVAVIAITAATTAYHGVIAGALFTALGLSAALLGAATLGSSDKLHGASSLLLGGTLLGFLAGRWSGDLRAGNHLPLVALGCLGLALLGNGLTIVRGHAVLPPLQSWLTRLTSEPRAVVRPEAAGTGARESPSE